MIRVQRLSAPAVLVGEDSPGGKEKARAGKYYQKLRQGIESSRPGQTAYNLPEVRLRLDEMFASKCAYCESSFQSASGDVEHYRPKNAVELENGARFEVELGNGLRKELGYWWLAAEWDNLLYSCIQCNQPRRRANEAGQLVPGGKGIKFPIENEASRAFEPGQEATELRLLINPCIDDPSEHLFIVLDHLAEQGGMMLPRRLPDDREDPMGSTSIRIFDLNNPSIIQRRTGKLRTINNRKFDFDDAIRDLNEALAEGRDVSRIDARMRRIIDELAGFLDIKEEDLMMSRAAICPYLKERGLTSPSACG